MAIDMTIVLIVSSFIIFLYIMILNRKPKGSQLLNMPPGPPKLPIIGNIHQIGLSQPHRTFIDLANKYGPIMSIQVGQIPMIIISSPPLAEEALKTNDLALASRPYALFADIMLYGGIDVVFGRYGDYWRQMKKLVTMELLSAKKVQSFMTLRKSESDRMVESIQSSSGKPVHLHAITTKLNNSIVCKALFGNNYKQEDVFIEAMDQATIHAGEFLVADLFPKLGFLSVISGTKSKLTELSNTIDKLFDELFEERRIRRQTTGPTEDDLTDVLFNIKEQGGLRFPVTDNNIKAIFINLITGGTDTSTVTSEWAMTELMRNPQVMKKAQKEVREVFKGRKTVEETELHKLVYLKQIIKETLRLHVTIPLLLPRECRESCKIGGYDIPKGMKVIVNALACANDPKYWDDPESFKPERFENSTHDFYGTNFEFFPFGAGRRMCPGISFGLVGLENALAKLLYHFNWELPDGMHPKDMDMTERYGGTTVKKVRLQLIPTLHIPF